MKIVSTIHQKSIKWASTFVSHNVTTEQHTTLDYHCGRPLLVLTFTCVDTHVWWSLICWQIHELQASANKHTSKVCSQVRHSNTSCTGKLCEICVALEVIMIEPCDVLTCSKQEHIFQPPLPLHISHPAHTVWHLQVHNTQQKMSCIVTYGYRTCYVFALCDTHTYILPDSASPTDLVITAIAMATHAA